MIFIKLMAEGTAEAVRIKGTFPRWRNSPPTYWEAPDNFGFRINVIAVLFDSTFVRHGFHLFLFNCPEIMCAGSHIHDCRLNKSF